MVGTFCLLLGLTFMWFGVIVPLHGKTVRIQKQRSQEAIRAQKALAVRSFYPGLEKLTPSELRKTYDVEAAYHRIGRF